jgi:hypothetical protein
VEEMCGSLKYLIALIIICILIQPIIGQPTPCRIIVNNGGAVGAYVEVWQGSNMVKGGATDNYGVLLANLNYNQGYTVKVDYNGRHSNTDITATDPMYVFV